MIDVVAPRSGLITGKVPSYPQLDSERCSAGKCSSAPEEIGRLDAERSAKLEPPAPSDEEAEGRDAAEMLEDVVELDGVNRLVGEVEGENVGEGVRGCLRTR